MILRCLDVSFVFHFHCGCTIIYSSYNLARDKLAIHFTANPTREFLLTGALGCGTGCLRNAKVLRRPAWLSVYQCVCKGNDIGDRIWKSKGKMKQRECRNAWISNDFSGFRETISFPMPASGICAMNYMKMWKLIILARISNGSNDVQAACRVVFFLPRTLADPRSAGKYPFPNSFKGFRETISFSGRTCFFCQRICLFSNAFWWFDGVCVFLTFAVEAPET